MIENLANIADIVSAILVILTLVFLTFEIRHNTQALRATTIQAVTQSEMALAQILIDNAETWEKILTSATLLPGTETRKAIMLYNVLMADTESRYHQHLAGLLDAQAWEGRRENLPKLVRLAVFPLWRNSFGATSHSTGFLAMIDGIAAQSMQEEGPDNA